MANTTWGRWTFNPSNSCLETHITSTALYQVDVEEMTNSASILDWIFQVSEKTWASSQDTGDLVKAIVELLGRGVASGGIDHPLDAKALLAKVFGEPS